MKDFEAGAYVRQRSYGSFQPTPINRFWTVDDVAVLQLLSQADRQLGRLDTYAEYIPNVELFIRMHVVKEATRSSRIEGARTRLEEALLDLEAVPAE